MRGFFQLVMANVKDIVRDRMSIFWYLAFPIIFILIFGTVFGRDQTTTRYSIGLVLEDQGTLWRGIKRRLRRPPFLSCMKVRRMRRSRRCNGGSVWWW